MALGMTDDPTRTEPLPAAYSNGRGNGNAEAIRNPRKSCFEGRMA